MLGAKRGPGGGQVAAAAAGLAGRAWPVRPLQAPSRDPCPGSQALSAEDALGGGGEGAGRGTAGGSEQSPCPKALQAPRGASHHHRGLQDPEGQEYIPGAKPLWNRAQGTWAGAVATLRPAPGLSASATCDCLQ